MNMYTQISLLVFLLICFGIYKLFKKKKSNTFQQQSVTKEEFKPYLKDIDIQKEDKVRKQWLISFFTITTVSAGLILLSYMSDGLFTEFAENTENALSLLLGLTISSLALIPWFWITYHCSYKKRGTAWLMWTMISLPLRELASIIKGELNQVAEWDSLGLFILITSFGIEIFYWINCLRLYKVNSFRKYQKALALKANIDQKPTVSAISL